MLNYWQLDFDKDTELANLKADLATSRSRLDSALFKHLAMLAPVAVGGMGMFVRGGSSGDLRLAAIAMITVPAVILVVSVMLSALSLAIAPTNVVKTIDPDGKAILRTRDQWVAELRHGVGYTNWHRGFEDNVQFYGFSLAAFTFLVGGVWFLMS